MEMESMDRSIQLDLEAAPDALRCGLAGVKSDIIATHPVEFIQQNDEKQRKELKRNILAKTYGSAFPLKLDIEHQILSRCQRPPGMLPSSMLGLEASTGALEEFSFEDFLNDPRDSESFVAPDMHHGMEVRLGLSKGPACRSFI